MPIPVQPGAGLNASTATQASAPAHGNLPTIDLGVLTDNLKLPVSGLPKELATIIEKLLQGSHIG